MYVFVWLIQSLVIVSSVLPCFHIRLLRKYCHPINRFVHPIRLTSRADKMSHYRLRLLAVSGQYYRLRLLAVSGQYYRLRLLAVNGQYYRLRLLAINGQYYRLRLLAINGQYYRLSPCCQWSVLPVTSPGYQRSVLTEEL
jgi:uncharacterized protein YegP (UPF0339 family)